MIALGSSTKVYLAGGATDMRKAIDVLMVLVQDVSAGLSLFQPCVCILLHGRLSPLMAAMKQLLYQGRVIHIDETPLQVLNKSSQANTQLSYMWVYAGGPVDKPVIWYQHADTRRGEVPEAFLYPEREQVLRNGPCTC